MKSFSTSVEKVRIEKNRENKVNITVGSLFLITMISAITLGIIFPVTIPYSLEIFRWSALFLLAAIAWRDVFNSIDSEKIAYRLI